MEARTWMDVLRIVNNKQGINITELLTHLGQTHKQSNRLVLTGYLRCMEDIGMLSADRSGTAVQMYTNGSSPIMLIKEFAEFQQMMHAKYIKAKQRDRYQFSEARKRYYRDPGAAEEEDL
jgi:hypothetical protein